MSEHPLAARLRRPLVWATGAVFAVGSLSAFLVEPAPVARDAKRPDTITLDGTPGPVDPGAGAGEGNAIDGGSADGPRGAGGVEDPPATAPPVATEPLGPSAVPAPGIYRYEVQTTDEDGESVVQEELREVVVLAGDRAEGTVQVSAQLAGESQVSVLEWSPAGALVRSTRIESSDEPGRECSWEPPFPELGVLGAGERWTLRSTCRVPVAGVDTVFRVAGNGQVVGEATVAFAGGALQVWELRRDRTTTIEAEIGGTTQRQEVRETGTIFFDPGRGVVVRSDVTTTLAGSREGVTRRISVLQP